MFLFTPAIFTNMECSEMGRGPSKCSSDGDEEHATSTKESVSQSVAQLFYLNISNLKTMTVFWLELEFINVEKF